MLRSRFTLAFGSTLELSLAMGEGAPPESQALVVPQDVHLILGDVGVLEDPGGDPHELARKASTAPARRPGSIVVSARDGGALLMQAVVYDFSRTPHARGEDVLEALLASFEEARARRLEQLALQPLGTAHLGVEPADFLRLLLQICYGTAELGSTLRHVALVLASRQELERYEALLKDLAGERGTPAERA